MKKIVFFFEVHQPRRIRYYKANERGKNHEYFWDDRNAEILNRVSDKCYIPATQMLIDSGIKASISISGVLLEALLRTRKDVVEKFAEYFEVGGGEIVAETYYHSLSSLWNESEFKEQVKMDSDLIKTLFNRTPTTFRNSELIYSNEIGRLAHEMGYKNIIAEGTDQLIKSHDPNYLYENPYGQNLLLRNYRLSDDVSFRFSNRSWSDYPLFADKYAKWLADAPGDVINLFMDYETFGEHQWKETGIFEFMKALPKEVESREMEFSTISEIGQSLKPRNTISVPNYTSWADTSRDLSAWLGNDMQMDAFEDLKSLSNCADKETWRYLQTTDHLYYMSLAGVADQEVHSYFNPYGSPYDAYIHFKNIIEDFRMKCSREKQSTASPLSITTS